MASLTDAEQTLRSTNAKANFQRLTRLLICGGAQLLREKFDCIHKPSDLPKKLSDPATKKLLKGAQLTKDEWKCLYPGIGTYGKSSDFDITLIFRLFRNICSLTPPPSSGWDKLPIASDHSLEADLARIKYYRNKIHAHTKTMEVRDDEFVTLWKEISEALLRIAAGISHEKRDEWKKSIDEFMSNDHLTPEAERFNEELQLWYEKDRDVKREIQNVGEKMDGNFEKLWQEFRRLREDSRQSPHIVGVPVRIVHSVETMVQGGVILTLEQLKGERIIIIPVDYDVQEQTAGVESGLSHDRRNEENWQELPKEEDFWDVVAKYTDFFSYLEYLVDKCNLILEHLETGSLLVTIECSSLQTLEELWEDYISGHLNEVVQEIFVTDDVLEKLGLTEVKLKTNISEEEYKKGKQILMDRLESNNKELATAPEEEVHSASGSPKALEDSDPNKQLQAVAVITEERQLSSQESLRSQVTERVLEQSEGSQLRLHVSIADVSLESPRTHKMRGQELRETQITLEKLQQALIEEQREKARVDEELSQARINYSELEERWESELAQMRNMLREKEKTVEELQRIIEQQAKSAENKELNQALTASSEFEERFENDLAQLRQTLEGELRLRNSREEELRDKENRLEELQRTLREERQESTRVADELNQARNACIEVKERHQSDLVQMHEALESEIQLGQAREQELNNLQKILEGEKKARNRVEEELNQVEISRSELEERFRNDLVQMHQALEDEVLLRSRKEQELDDLQKTLGNDQVERPTTNEALSQGRVPYTELEERIESDIVQMRRTLDDKERVIQELQNTLEEGQQAITRVEEDLRQARLAQTNLEDNLAQTQQRLSTKEHQIRDTESTVFEFQKALEEEQQAKTRVVEELRQARCAYNEVERCLVQIRQTLDDEVHVRETREQELRDKERITDELQSALREEQRRRTLVDEELSQARNEYTELEERLRNELAQMRRTLDDKERVVDNLQQNVVQEQQARTLVGEELSQARIAITELEGRLQDSPLQGLQNVTREQWLRVEEERQKGNALEVRPRRLELPMRNAEEMQLAVFTTEEASFESQRRQTIYTGEEEMRHVAPTGSKQQKALVEDQSARSRVDEELNQARCSFAEREGYLVQIGRTEQELRNKDAKLHELQRTLVEEQQARTAAVEELSQTRIALMQLEEEMQNDRLLSQSLQEDLQNVIGEQRRRLEEDRQQRTALEERLRSLELRLEQERDSRLSAERELRSAVSAAEHQRRQESRDWIIQREEVVLSETRLGQGAWGIVYKGTFRGCEVAIKVIHDLILSSHNRRLFEREMDIASRCRHPNLLQLIGATNDEGRPLFVTEILDTNLRQTLCQRTLNLGEIVLVALDVAKGLNYLHLTKPLSIIHRDVSSSNVLLWRRDHSWRAKLSDYGTSKVMQQSMTVAPGSIVYSAPESFTPQQSPKVDVYSFGVLLCEMCISELPDPDHRLRQISQVYQSALRGLIQRCVQEDPDARPTMSEVIYELEQLTESSLV